MCSYKNGAEKILSFSVARCASFIHSDSIQKPPIPCDSDTLISASVFPVRNNFEMADVPSSDLKELAHMMKDSCSVIGTCCY